MHNAPKTSIASSAQDDAETSDESEPVWLSERQLEQKGPQEQTDQPAPDKSAETTADQVAANTEGSVADPEQSAGTAELGLSKTEVTMAAGAESGKISAQVGGIEDEITFSVATEKNLPEGHITTPEETDAQSGTSTYYFRVRTSSSIKPGTYQITVTAKNVSYSLTKVLTVTVES